MRPPGELKAKVIGMTSGVASIDFSILDNKGAISASSSKRKDFAQIIEKQCRAASYCTFVPKTW